MLRDFVRAREGGRPRAGARRAACRRSTPAGATRSRCRPMGSSCRRRKIGHRERCAIARKADEEHGSPRHQAGRRRGSTAPPSNSPGGAWTRGSARARGRKSAASDAEAEGAAARHAVPRTAPRSRRRSGKSICDALLESHIDIEHACEKSCACTTCHVVVRKATSRWPRAEEKEEDLLDKAWGLEATSRSPARQSGRRGPQHRDPEVHHQLRARRRGEEMKWTDTLEIAIALADQHPDQDPKAVNFVDLYNGCSPAGFQRRSEALRREDSRSHPDGLDRRGGVAPRYFLRSAPHSWSRRS